MTKQFWVKVQGEERSILVEACEADFTKPGLVKFTRIFKDGTTGEIYLSTPLIVSAAEAQDQKTIVED